MYVTVDESLEEEVLEEESETEEESEAVSDDNEQETEEEETEESNDSSDDDDVEDDNEEDEESEIVITIDGEESPPQEEEIPKEAPKWVKGVRKNNRELKKQVRELQEQLKTTETTENQPVELGTKPTLQSMDYDEDRYESETQKWYERKIEVDKQNAKIKEEKDLQESKWQERLRSYNEHKDKLKVVDYDEAESVAQDILSTTQQGMIVEGADNPAILIYALGKNPKKLKEMSNITDPVKFAFAAAKLETQLKVANKKRPTSKPEKRIQGSSVGSTASNHNLDKLRANAEKTGDYTKVIQYKKQLKNKGK